MSIIIKSFKNKNKKTYQDIDKHWHNNTILKNKGGSRNEREWE